MRRLLAALVAVATLSISSPAHAAVDPFGGSGGKTIKCEIVKINGKNYFRCK